MAYMGGAQAATAHVPGGVEELAEVLCLYTSAMEAGSPMEAMPCIKAAVDKLAATTFRQRVQGQLDQLSGGQEQQERLLSIQQLQYGCCRGALILAAGFNGHPLVSCRNSLHWQPAAPWFCAA
jgi:hypothetical protein